MLRMLRIKLLLLILLAMPTFCMANIYKKVDANGVTRFSDQPFSGSEKIYIDDKSQDRVITNFDSKEPSRFEQAKQEFLGSSEKSASDENKVAYQKVFIASPSNGETFWNQPSIIVSVGTEPHLDVEHNIQLFVDNRPFKAQKGATRFSISELPRGEHKLKASVVDQHGKVIMESTPVTIFVHKKSVGVAAMTTEMVSPLHKDLNDEY